MAGLSAAGFERKRLETIKTNIEDALKLLWGDNIDVTPQSVIGQEIGILSEAISDQWESQEDVYNSQYPSTAQSTQLSNVVMLNGIERQEETNSTVTAHLSGIAGTVIPSGSKAKTSDTNAVFVTTSIVTIGAAGIDVSMESEDKGEIEAAVGTLTVIDTPKYGWTGITNTNAATTGQEEETDAELRERREVSTQALGQNLVDSLWGQLLDIENVSDAVVKDNKTASLIDGIPAWKFDLS